MDLSKTDDETFVRHWLDEVACAEKLEKNYKEGAKKIVEMYEAQKDSQNNFNILYSNTETLAPALYSVTPRPKIGRRFKDDDLLGKASSQVLTRLLEYFMDSGDEDYSNFDDLMKQVVVEALVPGRGVTRFKYDAQVSSLESLSVEIGGRVGETTAMAGEQVSYETICGEEIPWDRFLHGYAKKWKDVPWIGYTHFLNKEELKANFGDLGDKVTYASPRSDGDTYDQNGQNKPEGQQIACVYEIWDKKSKQVIFVSEGLPEQPLKVVDDPYGLAGFFPSPQPLTFTRKISDLIPTPLYKYYELQAKELNRITARIKVIVEALKVRGFYDGGVEGMENLLAQPDNTLMPLPNVSALADGASLENAIWFFPIQSLVPVLQQLYVQREQVKQIIYEITGISDILRGSSAASESATAQRIKNEWGNLRLRRWQREVQRYARDSLRIMAELSVTKLSQETITQITGLQFPSAAEKQQAQQMMEMAMQAPPEQQQQMQESPEAAQIQKTLDSPSWEEILALLQNDVLRSYKVDIETNSTLDSDVSEDKENMTDFINGMSQFFLSVTPLVEKGTLPFEAAQAILMQMVRRFNFGETIEDQLAQMQAPQPAQDEETTKEREALEQEKAALELQKQQSKLQAQQQEMEIQFKQREAELEIKFQQRMAELEIQARRREMEMAVKAQQQQAVAVIKAAQTQAPQTDRPVQPGRINR